MYKYTLMYRLLMFEKQELSMTENLCVGVSVL